MSEKLNIVETADQAGTFKTLIAAATAAGLADTLTGAGPLTVFAPNDEAFAKVPAATLTELLKPENKEKLAGILTYHVVSGKVTATDAAKLTTAKTVNGQELKIDASNGVKVNDANVITADVEASNGIIHIIDSVLMPAAAAKSN